MNGLKIFETVENGRRESNDGEVLFVLSAICDDDGKYTISVNGDGGIESAQKAVEWLGEIVSTPYKGE